MNIRFSGFDGALVAWLFAAAVAMFPPASASAAALPGGYAETLYASGISKAVAMEFAPDGRLFVCEQAGSLRVIKNGALLSAPFVTVDVNDAVERGLLGIAFDPGFKVNQHLYVYYTAKLPTVHNRVSRFTAAGDVAAPGSETILLELDNLSAENHNGGAIHFGLDGKLYIGAGENGRGDNAQTLSNLLGKLLRINADGSIPTDNPFYGSASGRNRAIWALGLRNPFTFAVQPGSGRIFVNDVGNSAREEIDELARGGNYGWPDCEGACAPANSSFLDPIYFYSHGAGNRKGNCIAGGTFYNPPTSQFPATEVGAYYFSDYTSGWIGKLPANDRHQVVDFAAGINAPVDLKTGPDGRLYYLSRGAGTVMAIYWTHPLAGLAGSYQGLFYETNGGVRHGASGFFSLVLRADATYSGRLQQGTKRYAFTGAFDVDGNATNSVKRPGTNGLTAELVRDRDSQITGRISDGSWDAALIADRATFDARTNLATNFANHYTLLVPGSADGPLEPAGDGTGSVIVDASGRVRLTGVLADGSPMAQKVPLSPNGAWPFYVSLYGGRGSALGWILITNSAQPDLGGLVSWSRPPGPKPKVHTNGFVLDSMLIGSAYRVPGTNTIFGETNAVLILRQGGLSESVMNNVSLAPGARVTYAGTNKLTLQLTQKSGAFAGKITAPGANKSTAFKGAILQKQGYGGGFFLGTNQSGRVEFRPAP
ncbi:MAG TPA: PQQ-dependent sugar dehydrogenase [Verrucomicrobiae bacterium]|nr:PQQ-dependent sugar dehydrogenase [Verrucomicrobiae bacterium]